MSNYVRPDTYFEKVNTGEQPIELLGTTTCAMIGKSVRGKTFEPVLVTSWSDFIRKFAKGMPMPFIKEDFLAYSVYGFFQNGGNRLYIVRVVDSGAKKSTGTLTLDDETNLTFTAIDEGDWGNGLVVDIKSQPKTSGFVVTVKLNDNILETFVVSNGEDSPSYYVDVINNSSENIRVEGKGLLKEGTVNLTSGVQTYASVNDNDYQKAIKNMSMVTERISAMAIPHVTSTATIKALADYCQLKDIFPVIDSPFGNDTETEISYRDGIQGEVGAIYYPNIKVVDPLSSRGALKLCPVSGHILGLMVNTDVARGVQKVPAGEGCVIKGAVALEKHMTDDDIDKLNPIGVNCLVARPNKGIIPWGARTISGDPKFRYISDIRIDQLIRQSCLEGTRWAVFEPNDAKLWLKISTALKGMLQTLYENGVLVGATPNEAYYVKCDKDLNPQASIDRGEIVAEIGYAKNRPAEFVIIRMVQKVGK